jgi:beta-1,4-N-acetylglucosaminyltransferase
VALVGYLSKVNSLAAPKGSYLILIQVMGFSNTKIVFVESFARVRSLSLSGKILYYLADRFIVQWPKLKESYPRAEYYGVLV